MELSAIREELDRLDNCLDFIVLLRTSLAILVGEVKSEQKLPVCHPDRERNIYDARVLFSEKTGVNIDLLLRIYRTIIYESIRIEENPDEYGVNIDNCNVNLITKTLNKVYILLDNLIYQMDIIMKSLNDNDVKGNEFFKTLAIYYKQRLNSTINSSS
ncbi:TPA: chorismate mutase, partial [Escherichia coli]|nr:chorismate mutase [Escherichia coli]